MAPAEREDRMTDERLDRLARPRFGPTLAGIVAVGIVIRVLYAVLMAPWPAPVGSDAWFYHHEANLLAQGRGFINPAYAAFGVSRPSAAHPPLYPLLLAGLSKLGGTGQVVQRLAGAAFGAGTIAALGFLGRRLVSERVGLIAAGIAALYPMLITADGALMSETLYGLLIALTLVAAYRLTAASRVRIAIQLGALLGLAALTRGEAVLLVPLLLLPLLRHEGARRLVLVATGVFVLVVAPWSIRNWTVFDRPVPISTNLASAIAGANCPATYYGNKIGDWNLACVKPYAGNEAVAFDHAESHALSYAAHHITRVPVVFAVRLARVWGLRRNVLTSLPHLEGRSPIALEFGFGMYYALVPLAVYGLLLLRRRRVPVWPLASMFVLVSIVAVLIYGEIRFREPADIALVVLAAVAVDQLVGRVRLPASGKRNLRHIFGTRRGTETSAPSKRA